MSDYSSNFPTQSPTFAFDAKAGKLDSRLSYARSSTGTAFSAEKHLSSENLLPYSNDLSNASWTKANTTASSGATGPDGTANASSVLETTANDGHSFYDNFEVVNGVSYTFVAFVKGNGRTKVKFQCQAQPTIANVEFDLTAVTSTVLTGSAVSHAIVASGGTGWYRCSVTVVAGGTGAGYHQIHISDGSSYSYAGDITKGVFIFGTSVSSTQQLYVSETASQIHREFAPTLKTAAADEPRFEYAADGQSVGLLIESQATNLYPNSSDMTGNSGALTNVDLNVAVGPTGDLTADALRLDATDANAHYRQYNFTAASSTAYTFSAYVKTAGLNYIAVRSNNLFASNFTYFNLSNGTVEGSPAMTSTIESVGNGWQRVSVNATTTGSGTASFIIYITDSASSTTVATGDSYRAVLGTGIQIEASSAPSSLISTSGSTASRAADSCSVVDATLFSSGEHTIIWEGDTDYAPNDKRFFALSDGSMNNRFVADHDNGTATRLRNWADGVKNVDKSTGVVDMLVGSHKLAATVKTNESQLVVDGTRRQVDTSCVVGSGIDQLAINSTTTGAGSTYNMNGHCKRITYYNVALSQAEAEALTSNP